MSQYEHWQFFRAIEDDVIQISRFVEFVSDNFPTHSIELCRTFLSVCSEIDVVAKVLCKQVNPNDDASNINEYRTSINANFPKLATSKVTAPRFRLEFEPWKEWGSNLNPPWWQDYNKVKHSRHLNYREANLSNTLSATAALFILVLYLYHEDLATWKFKPKPELFSTERGGKSRLLADRAFTLPDFAEHESP